MDSLLRLVLAIMLMEIASFGLLGGVKEISEVKGQDVFLVVS